jgi:putative permease
MNLLTEWYKRYLSNPEVIFFGLFLILCFVVIITMGDMLIPLLSAVVIAYLLEGLVAVMERRVPRMVAVVMVFSGFMLLVLAILLGVVPLISQQVTEMVQTELPRMIGQGQKELMRLPEAYPEIITEDQVEDMIATIRNEFAAFGQAVLSMSLASVVGLLTVVVYLILIPLLVFFFLKDKRVIVDWFVGFLPKERKFADMVWYDVDRQIGNYVRGKFVEIIVIWSASFVTFSLFGLNYAMLLGMLVGLSVIIPYIGAAVVTFPVLLVAWFQWGWGADFAWLAVAYFVIQALDGNVLVPLLFSEVVNLHPVAIIVAILVFGGFWGFWGVFFAIPLATLVQAIINAWPDPHEPALEESEQVAA